MNIFVTSPCPYTSAQVLDNVRLNKMILESVQLLQVAGVDVGYKPTHQNHPCAVWLRKDDRNISWLAHHLHGLHTERIYRGNWTTHKSYASAYPSIADRLQIPFPHLTNWQNSTDYKELDDVFKAYRQHLIDKWNNDRNPKWGRRGPPIWYRKD